MRWATENPFRRRSLPVLLVAGIGCAFSPGEPWGRVEASLSIGMPVSQGRMDSEGRLVTASDYRVRLDRLEVRGGEIRFVGTSATGSVGSVTFDPAHPPEGYTFCHGGHCHAADGRLVPYDDIIAELGGESGDSRDRTWLVISWDVERVEVPPGRSMGVPLGPCPGDCAVPEGTLTRLEVTSNGLFLEGVVFDARTGDGRRLPEEGVPFRGTVSGEFRFLERLAEVVGPGHSVRVRLAATLDLPEALFDSVDFAALSRSAQALDLSAAETAVQEALVSGTVLRLVVER